MENTHTNFQKNWLPILTTNVGIRRKNKKLLLSNQILKKPSNDDVSQNLHISQTFLWLYPTFLLMGLWILLIIIIGHKVTSNPNYEELMEMIVLDLRVFKLKIWFRMPLESVLKQGKISWCMLQKLLTFKIDYFAFKQK